MKTTSFELKASGPVRLFGLGWEPVNVPVKTVIVLVHGLGEHTGRYKELARFFTSRGCALYGCDLRGHGRSPGKRGHALYPQLLNDLSELIQYAERQHPGLPLILYGHSMGGNIAANFVLDRPEVQKALKAVVLSSPWLRLNIPVSPVVVQLSRLMQKVYPSFTQKNKINAEWLSKDPLEVKAYQEDPLVHPYISVSLFYQVHEHGMGAVRKAKKLSLPLLVMHGSEDRITSCEASRRLAEKAPHAQWKLWKGVRHEPHHELEKREVMQFVWEWMEELLQQKPVNE
ncbi:alpha/beta hydrolase [Nafulsella turpanensis]|uniref:alpha/beta hydrolase n=1 Tax=Nafulsella turpanensis TaxID=1265690 RepID=UPI000344FB1F|nr:alpha/beta hydrolase [Nafulsella turpanensis]